MNLENIKNQLENNYKELMDYVKELEEFKKYTEYTCDSTTIEMIKGNMENQENSKLDKQDTNLLTDREMAEMIRDIAWGYDVTDFDSMGELSLEVKDLLIEQNYIRKNLTRTSENRNTDSALIYALLVNLAEIREEYNEEITDETIDNPVEDFSEGKFGDVIYELFA